MNSPPFTPRIIGKVRAIYSYYSEEQSSLNFKKGDSIDVLTKLESGWWDGWCQGERGWFPSNYVEEIDNVSKQSSLDTDLLPKSTQRASSIYSSSTNSDHINSTHNNLPDGWTIQMAKDGGSRHYYNQHTDTISNELPEESEAESSQRKRHQEHRESFFRPAAEKLMEHKEEAPTQTELMDNWVERQTPQGRVYFCNLITQETTWDYNEIDTETGHLKKLEKKENDEDNEEDDENSTYRDALQIQSIPKELTWNKIASDIAFGIHELTTAISKKQKDQIQSKTAYIVESIRLMLYASRALDKDSLLLQDPTFREPRRSITSTLSKLVLDSKSTGDLYDSSMTASMFEKIQKDANDIMVSVRNFVTLCQQRDVDISNISPRLVRDLSQLNFDAGSPDAPKEEKNQPKTITSGMANLGLSPDDRKKINKATSETNSSLLQKARYLLNQDLVVSLQVYSHQIYTSAEDLSATAHYILTIFKKHPSSVGLEQRSASVTIFRTLSNQIGQYIAILDDINFDTMENNPLMPEYQTSRQSIYSVIGHLFGAVQTLTDLQSDVHQAIEKVDKAVIHVENVIETVEQCVIAMVNERQQNMNSDSNASRRTSISESSVLEATESSSSLDNESEFGEYNPEDNKVLTRRRPTLASGISVIVERRRQQSIRPGDRTLDSTDTLGHDHHPDEIEISKDKSIKGGTLVALVERLTVHNTSDTNFIATFLLTYRSFCTSEEFITLLENRYNLRPPERLTPDQLEMWTERKQKLVRLRVFNVIKNWLESYYIDEDEYLLTRLEHFTKSYIRDSSEFAAKQILNLIKKRVEAGGEIKKIIPNVISGPEPILPKNIENITLLDTEPVEMARQLSVMDFKLYSSVRPIECLGKAWSKDGDRGSVAVNIKKSIQYCNRLTSWVTYSILFYDEPKKRATIIKYWVHVADQCRILNNFNTCMAILSSFDNSAIGRLKKTWMMCNRTTTQTLASIRKLLGANRNFTEYREIIHSVNPPCIPFLGIYLQDLTFIEDGNSDFLRKSNNMINFAKRHKVAEVIRELKQFQSFAYNFQIIPEFQDFIRTELDFDHDSEQLYERSLQLEPRVTEMPPSIYLAGNVM